jgi:serine/threonine-protein kinase
MKSTSDPVLSEAACEPDIAQLCDEIIERLQAGEPVDLVTLTHEHPEHADRLRRLLPALEALVDLAASAVHPASRLSRSAQSRRMPTAAPRVLGDYRILREIGRGGMGVVYEAEQRTLNRRVALKVLPMAAALDDRQFQRFQLEAQAAACLHHNNIVPIFAVGTEGGVPYYAMQFIEGRSLANVIAELRRAEGLDPAGRLDDEAEPRIADLTTTALARSLLTGDTGGRHATGPGIVEETEARASLPAPGVPPSTAAAPVEIHVDREAAPRIAARTSAKPGSSTHTRGYARTVAGLGLQAAEALDHAHTRGILHRDIKPGNLLLDADGRLWIADFGLAQIQGNHGLTLTGDVLGTLRYMSPEQALAKRVVIDGRTDIYSLGVTLYELLTLRPAVDGEDRAEILRRIADREPPSPSASNPGVPRDLETVVRKAMAKEPADRYATAKELADDLRRFLESHPIAARPPSLVDRVAKWARRHSTAVVTAAVFLVLVMVGLGASTFLVNRERDEAVRQRDEARRQQEFARRAVDAMYSRVAVKWLAEQPRMKPLQREFLQEALRYYQEFARSRSLTPDELAEAATAYQRVGRIQAELGQTTEARDACDQATSLLRRLVDDRPESAELRKHLSDALDDRRSVARRLGDLKDAERLAREALVHRQWLVDRFPGVADYEADLADGESDLGNVLSSGGRLEEADSEFRQAADRLRALLNGPVGELDSVREQLDRTRHNHAQVLRGMGRLGDAEDALREGLRLLESLDKKDHDRPQHRLDLANRHFGLGLILQDTGRPALAEAEYRLAIDHFERLTREFPEIPDHRSHLADAYDGLAAVFLAQGHGTSADHALAKSLSLHEALVRDFPDQAPYGFGLAVALGRQGQAYHRSGRLIDAEAAFRRAINVVEGLVASSPGMTPYRDELAVQLNALGIVLYSLGPGAEAEAPLRRAISIFEETGNTPNLATTSNTLGLVLSATGRLDDAATSYQRSREIWTRLLADARHPSAAHNHLGGVLHNLGLIYKTQGKLDEARPLFEEAIKHEREALKDNPRDASARLFLRNHYSDLGATLAQLGDHRALNRLVEEMRAALPENGEIPAIAARCLIDVLPCLEHDTALTQEQRREAAGSYVALIRDLIDHAGRVGSSDPRAQTQLAQILADAPDTRFRDPSRAVTLARSASRRVPQDPECWTTLGLACYRAGALGEATAALKKAMELKSGGEPSQWLILAMTIHARGDAAESLRLYRQSLEWLKNRPDAGPRLYRLRDEAMRVVGVELPPSRGGPEPAKGAATKPR